MTNSTPNLKASGLKATLPRLKILEIFQSSKVRHLTAEDVYKILLNENMDVGLATVYRVLSNLSRRACCTGIILKLAKLFLN
jgi:Fur family ferric uptake transcriptional regulator